MRIEENTDKSLGRRPSQGSVYKDGLVWEAVRRLFKVTEAGHIHLGIISQGPPTQNRSLNGKP